MRTLSTRHFFIIIHCTFSIVSILLSGLSLKFEWGSINNCTYLFDWISGKGSLFLDKFNGVFGNLPFDFDIGDKHWLIPIPNNSGGKSFIDTDEIRSYVIKSFGCMLAAMFVLLLSIFPFGTILYKRLPIFRILFFIPIAFVIASISIFKFLVVPWFRDNLLCDVEQDGLGLTLSFVSIAAICTNTLILIITSLYKYQKRKSIQQSLPLTENSSLVHK